MQIDSSFGQARELVRQHDADQQRAVQVNHGPQDSREREDAVSASAKSEDSQDQLSSGNSNQKNGHRVDIRV